MWVKVIQRQALIFQCSSVYGHNSCMFCVLLLELTRNDRRRKGEISAFKYSTIKPLYNGNVGTAIWRCFLSRGKHVQLICCWLKMCPQNRGIRYSGVFVIETLLAHILFNLCRCRDESPWAMVIKIKFSVLCMDHGLFPVEIESQSPKLKFS